MSEAVLSEQSRYVLMNGRSEAILILEKLRGLLDQHQQILLKIGQDLVVTKDAQAIRIINAEVDGESLETALLLYRTEVERLSTATMLAHESAIMLRMTEHAS